MKDTCIIVLAAGNSSRMGSPKQLLVYQEKTFLERIIDTALEIFDPNKIVLVLGARHHEISSVIKNKNIQIVIN